MTEEREELRCSYKPDSVKLLLLGEAPPSKLEKFFYSGAAITAHTAKAFGSKFDTAHEPKTFLKHFKDSDCYLEDILHEPVASQETKNKQLADAFPDFCHRLKALGPHYVVVFLKGLDLYVRTALAQTGLNPDYHVLPFPGHGHQTKYTAGLTDILTDLKSQGKPG